MTPSKNAIELIKQCESFASKPYICPAGKPTIGYGTTKYPTGKYVTINDNPITSSQAVSYLMSDLNSTAREIMREIKTELTQSQFDALCSFVYNLGIINFKNSTLLKKINANPDDNTIETEFKKWIYVSVDGKKKILQGLVKRRSLEAKLYFS